MRIGVMITLLLAGCASNPPQRPQIARISAAELEQLLPRPQAPLSLDEIVRMSQAGASAEAIIEKIRESGSRYALAPSQAVELSRQGVDTRVLDHIHAANEQALRDGCADEINKRAEESAKERDALKRELLMRPYWGYDPFWWPYPPYWRHRFYWR